MSDRLYLVRTLCSTAALSTTTSLAGIVHRQTIISYCDCFNGTVILDVRVAVSTTHTHTLIIFAVVRLQLLLLFLLVLLVAVTAICDYVVSV